MAYMMNDPLLPEFKPVTSDTDAVEALGAFPNFPPLPPNAAVLAKRAAEDGMHFFMRLNYDVTHLTDDARKLLLFMLTNALTELEKGVVSLDKITVASRLAKFERLKGSNGDKK